MKKWELREIIKEELEKLKVEALKPETHNQYAYARMLYKKYGAGLDTSGRAIEFQKKLGDVMKSSGNSEKEIRYRMRTEDFLADEIEMYHDYLKLKGDK
jgi:glycerol-3-phosphate dehydrogenase